MLAGVAPGWRSRNATHTVGRCWWAQADSTSWLRNAASQAEKQSTLAADEVPGLRIGRRGEAASDGRKVVGGPSYRLPRTTSEPSDMEGHARDINTRGWM